MKDRIKVFKTLMLFGMLTLLLSGCGKENLTALIPKGYGAQKSYDLIMLTTIIVTGIFLVVFVVWLVVLFRFRSKKREKGFIPKQVEGHRTLETVWTAIPIILVIIIAIPTVRATFDLANTSDQDQKLNVEVTGNQFWWHFDYKGKDIQTSEDLYIPTGKKVYLNIKSADVIHSFWVPSIAGKLDANPENENTMYVKAFEDGVYYGKCAELCGPSHSLMDFKIIAVSPDKFDKWVKDMQDFDPKAKPESASAQEGQELFQKNNCIGCHAVGSSPVHVGPNLTDFGNRTEVAGVLDFSKENIEKWIKDPDSVKPGNKMAGNYPSLTDDEISKIADYLMQLKPTEVTPESVENK